MRAAGAGREAARGLGGGRCGRGRHGGGVGWEAAVVRLGMWWWRVRVRVLGAAGAGELGWDAAGARRRVGER